MALHLGFSCGGLVATIGLGWIYVDCGCDDMQVNFATESQDMMRAAEEKLRIMQQREEMAAMGKFFFFFLNQA